jgi:hypothetical protein
MILLAASLAVDSGLNMASRPLIQNLGPGALYIGPSSISATLLTDGISIPANGSFKFPPRAVDTAGREIFMQAATGTQCDVRLLVEV